MELPVTAQLLEAGWFLLLGGGLGLFYDLLGGLRHGLRCPAWLADAVFALAALGALFAAGMATVEGRTRLYMLAFAALGGCLWAWGMSPAVGPAWDGLCALMARGVGLAVRPLGLGWDFLRKQAKNLFSNLRKWFTIIGAEHRQRTKDRKTNY